MQLQPGAFNALLNNFGEWFTWSRSSACPCMNPTSGAANPRCPRCSGKGRLWLSATRAKAAIASSKVQLEWSKFGMWESGDMVLSVPENSPLYEMGQFDRVLCDTNTDTFSLVLIRGGVNEVIHGSVKSVSRVFWLDADSNIVDGAIPTVSASGVPSWAGAGAPPTGKPYTIEGEKFTEYYVFGSFPNDRMKHEGARLPRRMVLRKFDLLGRN